jgi:pSer/pThr/pTyr-binding forkhead associated (FHA) protein
MGQTTEQTTRHQLVITSGMEPGLAIRVRPSGTTLGTVGEFALAFSFDITVARRHAKLYLEAGELMIEDLGSRTGTYVNGARIDGPQPLRPDDLVWIGATALRVS